MNLIFFKILLFKQNYFVLESFLNRLIFMSLNLLFTTYFLKIL